MATKIDRANQGVAAVMRNLNAELAKLEERTLAGLFALGNEIIGASNKRVPRETSVLVNSHYVRKAQNNPKAVAIGYDNDYAAYVHESLEMKLKGKPRPYRGKGGAKARKRRAKSEKFNRLGGIGNYWDPQGEPKFLEKSVKERVKDGAATVAKYAKIQGRGR